MGGETVAQRKHNRRRRRVRGSFGPLLRLLSVFLTAVVIVVALTLFFKIRQVTVEGNVRYTAEEIIAVCGVSEGDNLILLDKYQIAQKLYTELPYITGVRINRDFPDGLKVEVTETRAVLALENGDACWLLNEEGKILEAVAPSRAEEFLVLRGMTPWNITVGRKLELAPEEPITAQRLLELIAELQKRGMLDRTECINAQDDEILHIAYDGRFDVELFYDADFAFKLDCLKAAVNELEPNETGIIRMTMDDENEVRLIPDRR